MDMSEKIKVGDRYGVYSVLSVTMPTTRINDATIKLKCAECGEEIEKNYNHMLKQFRHGKMDSCICYSGTNKSMPMTSEYEKLTTAISKIKAYYRERDGFECDKPKKIMKFMSAEDLDFSDDRYEYSLCTKDGSLRFVAGNVTFRVVLKSSVIDEIENNVSVSRKLSKYSARKKISDLVKSNKDKTTKEIIDGNTFICYGRDKCIQKVKIGSCYGSCIVDGIEKVSDVSSNYSTTVVLRCKKCGNIFTRAIKKFLDGCYFCTLCEKDGYRSYIHKKNSVINKSIDDKIKIMMERASIECMSDFSRYSANFECISVNEIEDLKLDCFSEVGEFSSSDFISVFGDSY